MTSPSHGNSAGFPRMKQLSRAPTGSRQSRSSPAGSGDASQKSGRSGRMRCAIYTRKSSEEGLDQEFNSLDAQREACEAYVRSQKHEGWQALSQRYDDPGYSGGNMDRPALAWPLADIVAWKIDVVVVYKVDRLTRALADFAKIVEVFDASQVSFVSITQSFNTTTSMGRLALNVLLSFAQFEREVTGERIRDKIAASKKKGLWMGGLPSLGYDVQDRKLVINAAEAAAVRIIFAEIFGGRLGPRTQTAAGRGGRRQQASAWPPTAGPMAATPSRAARSTRCCRTGSIAARSSTRGPLIPASMKPSSTRQSGMRFRNKLEANGVERSSHQAVKQVRLLVGVLFDANGEATTPTHAVKKGVRYRYYVSRRLITEKRSAESRGAQSGQRLPAVELERLVTQRLRKFFADPEVIENALPLERRDAPTHKRALAAAQAMVRVIDKGDEDLTTLVLRPLLTRVKVAVDRIEFDLAAAAVAGALLANERASAPNVSRAESMTRAEPDDGEIIRITAPARLQRVGHEMKLVVEGTDEDRTADPALLRLLVRANALARRIANNPSSTLEDISAQEGMGAPYAARLMRLNYLAP